MPNVRIAVDLAVRAAKRPKKNLTAEEIRAAMSETLMNQRALWQGLHGKNQKYVRALCKDGTSSLEESVAVAIAIGERGASNIL